MEDLGSLGRLLDIEQEAQVILIVAVHFKGCLGTHRGQLARPKSGRPEVFLFAKPCVASAREVYDATPELHRAEYRPGKQAKHALHSLSLASDSNSNL
jgi:hypothetical protein